MSEMGIHWLAYSGQIGGRSDWEDFVPAVFDYLQPDGYFKTHEAEISRINQSISHLEKDERMKEARTRSGNCRRSGSVPSPPIRRR